MADTPLGSQTACSGETTSRSIIVMFVLAVILFIAALGLLWLEIRLQPGSKR